MAGKMQPPMSAPGRKLRENLRNGLVARWPMDEGDGDKAFDRSAGGAHTGTFSGGMSRVATESGPAVDFDGLNGYIELGTIDTGNPLQLSGNRCTFSFWIYVLAGDSSQRIIDKSIGGNAQNGYALDCQHAGANGRMSLLIAGAGVGPIDNSYRLATWTNIVVTWDGSTWTVYRDGQFHNSVTNARTIPSLSTNCRIGTWNHDVAREFKGQLSDLIVYNRTLTPSEAHQLHANPYEDNARMTPFTAAVSAAVVGNRRRRMLLGIGA